VPGSAARTGLAVRILKSSVIKADGR
jgi:hypothetical protein